MMSESNRNLLTIGVFIITIVVAILLYVAAVIDWTSIVPVVLLLSGLWLLALGALERLNPSSMNAAPLAPWHWV